MTGALPDDRELARQILTELRDPRVAAAFACGGLLALAGALARTVCTARTSGGRAHRAAGGAADGVAATQTMIRRASYKALKRKAVASTGFPPLRFDVYLWLMGTSIIRSFQGELLT